MKTDYKPAPHELYETFHLPIKELLIDPERNMRPPPTDDRLREMAASMCGIRQLQNVLVVWAGFAYELVVGYTRALALAKYGEQLGLTTIFAMRIAAKDEDAARAAENFVRDNPTTFETAKFFSELCAGRPPLEPMPIKHVAVTVGKSEDYVRGLLRLYREVPAAVRAAWKEDREKRFTFHKLNDLVRLKHLGDEAGLNALLNELLSVRKKRAAAAPALGPKTGQQHLDDALRACGLSRQPDGLLVPSASALRGAQQKSRVQRLSRRQLHTMKTRLASVPAARLTQFTVGADTLFRFVRALLGEVPRSDAWSIIDHVLLEAATGEDGETAGDERRYLQLPDSQDQGAEDPADVRFDADDPNVTTSERRYLQLPDSQDQGADHPDDIGFDVEESIAHSEISDENENEHLDAIADSEGERFGDSAPRGELDEDELEMWSYPDGRIEYRRPGESTPIDISQLSDSLQLEAKAFEPNRAIGLEQMVQQFTAFANTAPWSKMMPTTGSGSASLSPETTHETNRAASSQTRQSQKRPVRGRRTKP